MDVFVCVFGYLIGWFIGLWVCKYLDGVYGKCSIGECIILAFFLVPLGCICLMSITLHLWFIMLPLYTLFAITMYVRNKEDIKGFIDWIKESKGE